MKSNISKAKKAFGYKPKTNLDQLIKIMVDDCLKQKDLIYYDRKIHHKKKLLAIIVRKSYRKKKV